MMIRQCVSVGGHIENLFRHCRNKGSVTDRRYGSSVNSVGNEDMNSCMYKTPNSDLKHRPGRRQMKTENWGGEGIWKTDGDLGKRRI